MVPSASRKYRNGGAESELRRILIPLSSAEPRFTSSRFLKSRQDKSGVSHCLEHLDASYLELRRSPCRLVVVLIIWPYRTIAWLGVASHVRDRKGR